MAAFYTSSVSYLFYRKKHDSDSATSFLRKDSSLIKKVINKKRTDAYHICNMYAQFHSFVAPLFFS
ncbi:hypothetical protein CUZ91_0350 [Enterococcus xinjiangensis]|nr:hypothetical protein [Enterococcus lactis]MBL4999297.1 hypothetical protein [Enterococcus lactis]